MSYLVLRSSRFVRSARRLLKANPEIATELRNTLTQMQSNPFDPSLRTHKLSGEMAGTWSCSAGYDLRIVFEFTHVDDKDALLLIAVGTHDEVY